MRKDARWTTRGRGTSMSWHGRLSVGTSRLANLADGTQTRQPVYSQCLPLSARSSRDWAPPRRPIWDMATSLRDANVVNC